MKRTFVFFLTAIVLVAAMPSDDDGAAHQWTHFRGSRLDGIAVGDHYPVTWSDSTSLDWMVPVEGRGWSSPVVFNNQAWLTSATADGRRMFAVAIDLRTGSEIFNIDLFSPDTVFAKHAVNSYATPTPAIEEGRVYVHFGRYGTACIDTQTGEKIWSRTDLQCNHVQGPGSSLFLHDDKLIVHMEGTDVQHIYALDKHTGATIWIAKRDPAFYEHIPDIGKKAYVTPIVIQSGGRELLITNGSAVCNAFDMETGEMVWYIPQGEDSTISMPVEYNGLIYFYTSFVTSESGEKYCELWAVDPAGEGDLTKNITWRLQFPILQLLTPVIRDGLLYTVDTRGILHCIAATSGETVYSEKLGGKFNASPVWAAGNIYLHSTRGETYVIRAGRTFELVAQNKLPGEIWATPAFIDGSILLRTSAGLYKISS